MDPEKVMAAIRKALGLGDDADRAQVVKALDAIAALQEALAGEPAAAEEPAPEEEPPAAASKDAADDSEETVAASDAPEDGDDTVAASDAAEVDAADMPGEEGEPGLEGEAAAVVGALAEAAGMDPAEVLALLRERAEEVVGLLAGAPADGTAAEDAAAGMSKVTAALSASKARSEALEAQVKQRDEKIAELSKRIEAVEADGLERQIEDAVSAGHILPAHRDVFRALAKADPAEFKAQLSKAADAPAVPTEDIVSGENTNPTPVSDSEPRDEVEVNLIRSCKGAGVSEAGIAVALAKHRDRVNQGRA